ncbi:MAG: glutamine amidotransferase [Planctomycetota bacterium]
MPDSAPILYLGDTRLDGAASYLAGVLSYAGLAFDYVASDVSALNELKAGPRRLIILSDYLASSLEPEGHDKIVERHQEGAGLLMLGGWESYHGLGGDWDDKPVAEVLPVVMSGTDDRINHDQPAFLVQKQEHPIVDGLPWDERPPTIGGYNRITPKPGTTMLLEVVRQRVRRNGDQFTVGDSVIDPMLVVSDDGPARCACLATDAAPHWVGPLVDWGTDNTIPSGAGRVACQGPGAEGVEVGQYYARFFAQLVTWAMGN